MPEIKSPLDLPVPTGKTVLLQHLQTLVLRGNPYWVGGVIKPEKFAGLVLKLASRYPLTRTERGRIYDRSIGLAVTHLVAFPTPEGVAWWVLSSEGKGGLADPSSPDFKAAKHALKADEHLEFGDYVLLYAHKKDARTLKDARTGKEKKVLKDTSTWTWKMTSRAYNEVRAGIEREVNQLNYGAEPAEGKAAYGLRGLLHYQRQRPLFSGVRTQVLHLHREADDLWARARKEWLKRHPALAERYGDAAGRLRSVKDLVANHLPKMGRFKVFGDPEKTIKSLTSNAT